ncbi:Hypp1145 [Branchiostoma lanceolatum]|uniref:Hypp1145 protein n=1 Tax=Branchiostoma lanceolatum TaxID=7740 RepID=A0A8K0ELQ7_BRALA|nr:Hypp1145 [Branchiostoma lanceolatum]
MLTVEGKRKDGASGTYRGWYPRSICRMSQVYSDWVRQLTKTERSAFKSSNYNKGGKLSAYMLQEALEDIIGFTIPKSLQCHLARRYVDEEGMISSGDFLRIATRLIYLWNHHQVEAEDVGGGRMALNMGGKIEGPLGMFM